MTGKESTKDPVTVTQKVEWSPLTITRAGRKYAESNLRSPRYQ